MVCSVQQGAGISPRSIYSPAGMTVASYHDATSSASYSETYTKKFSLVITFASLQGRTQCNKDLIL